ncbi:MAG: hypothetical protein ACK5D5_03930 [Bacteroidota bacterium]|jgi:hypothetical protein
MKNNFLFLFFSVVCISSFFSQNVTFRVTKDNPKDVKNFTAGIDPLFTDVNGMNGVSAGWGLRAEYLNKKLSCSFDFRNGFGTLGYDPDDKNTQNYLAIEAKTGLVLSDRTSSRNFRIILSSSSYTSGGYRYTNTRYFMCPGTARNIIVFNAGLYQLNNNFKYKNNTKADTSSIKDILFEKDGKEVKRGDSLWNVWKMNDNYGGFSSLAVTGGFTFRTIHNLFVDVDGWGTRSNCILSDFYIDGIFAPIITLHDYTFKSNNETWNVKAEAKRSFGWRMGWFIRKPSAQGFSQKIEFGQRPGIKTENYLAGCYFLYTFGLYIPLNLNL